ncbi:hypothetical protein [Pseudactinotalea sp. HY158]|uniref:hypothetical protein n=1 Tax=Pseudactinotalea sp. HY158 TaxID=2654547 RepID=UPI00129CBF78|nr:hypothetical protein [Pseudactinotalea sp. HY158]QGH70339.1 hypothetical protein GCE65_13195 [Pseudactinotalea sp. HY158]
MTDAHRGVLGLRVRARGRLAPGSGTRPLHEPFVGNRSIRLAGDLPASAAELPVQVSARLTPDGLVATAVRPCDPAELADPHPANVLRGLRRRIDPGLVSPGADPTSPRLTAALDELLAAGRIRDRTRISLARGVRVLVVVVTGGGVREELERVDPLGVSAVVLTPARWSGDEEVEARALLDLIPEPDVVASGRGITAHGDVGLLLRTVHAPTEPISAALARLPAGLVTLTNWIEPD